MMRSSGGRPGGNIAPELIQAQPELDVVEGERRVLLAADLHAEALLTKMDVEWPWRLRLGWLG